MDTFALEPLNTLKRRPLGAERPDPGGDEYHLGVDQNVPRGFQQPAPLFPLR